MFNTILNFLKDFLITLPAVVIAITVHEFSHGLAAYRMGDPTAKYAGRLTLNPLKHLDIIGVLCLLIFKFGWAHPVPVNMYNFKNPKKGMALCAAAGPAANIVTGFIALLILKLLLLIPGLAAVPMLYQMLLYIVIININLAVFNLVPCPPLDGSKMLGAVLSDSAYSQLMRFERYGMFVLILLLYTNILSRPLSIVTSGIYNGMLFLLSWF